DKRGTCTTKHGAIASLAAELGLEVQKHLGFYRMTPAMVPGIDVFLAPFDLEFVPATHCFLRYGHMDIDLTSGNRDGRAMPIESYDFVVPVAADATREDFARFYVEHLPRYFVVEPKLGRLPVPQIVELLSLCKQRLHARAAA